MWYLAENNLVLTEIRMFRVYPIVTTWPLESFCSLKKSNNTTKHRSFDYLILKY